MTAMRYEHCHTIKLMILVGDHTRQGAAELFSKVLACREMSNLPAKLLGCCKPIGQQQHLCNDLIVRQGHCYASEQSLEVVRQLAAATIPLPSRVHRHKNASVAVDFNRASHQFD